MGANFSLVKFIEDIIINKKYSPSSALAEARKCGYEVNFCEKTLYKYIDQGLSPNLTNSDLPVQIIDKKRSYHNVRSANNHNGCENL